MAVTTSVDICTLISKSPEIWHGRPVIAGTRVTVMGIVSLYQEGLTPEQIADQKYLSLAQVYAALTYYHANRLENEVIECYAHQPLLKSQRASHHQHEVIYPMHYG